jgi:hypothetical protein
MEPAFIDHCRRGVQFSKDLAQKYLPRYQLKARAAADDPDSEPSAADLEQWATEAADNLLSANTRFSHGRLIGATEAHDEVGLNVIELSRDDPSWEAYWELYVRGEVFMQMLGDGGELPVAKLFFDRESTLPTY